MANWGKGYEQGYNDCLAKVNAVLDRVRDRQEDKLFMVMQDIGKNDEGGPSMYAVANRCCGGVDAHSAGCRG